MRFPFATKLARAAIAAVTALAAVPASAHDGLHYMSGFAAGFLHPLSGLDHLLAMLAVGLWAAQSRRHSLWVLPLVFPLMLIAGAIQGMAGMRFPVIETGIAGSVLVLGMLIAFVVRMPLWASAALLSCFALLHGMAHGAEMPAGASPWTYGAGFLLATAGLHLAGLMLGASRRTARLGGGGIAVAGLCLVAG